MSNNRRMWIISIGFVLLLSACDKGQIFHRLRPDSVILAFGDGLTFGNGTDQGSSYPAQLEKLIARKVVNAGVAGEGSTEGAGRLPAVLAEHEPDLVILGYGGADQPQEHTRQPLEEDLRRMFEAANQRGIPVMMIAVSPPGMTGKGATPYAELAEELKIPLVHAAAEAPLSDPQTKGAQFRRSTISYRKLAETVADKLHELRSI